MSTPKDQLLQTPMSPEEEIALLNQCLQQAVAAARARNRLLGLDDSASISLPDSAEPTLPDR